MSCLRSIAALILLQCGEYTSLECVVLQPNRKKTNERCITNKDASFPGTINVDLSCVETKWARQIGRE